ncbi:MAG: RES family NAD+ phosphorylase [Candidatus Acidiferrum sp.]
MNIVAWRIVHRRFAKSAFTGDGARRFGGRWNSLGRPVIYTAQSQALAALEILVHLDSEKLLRHYLAIPVTIPPHLIERLSPSSLPKNWRAYPTPRTTRAIGDAWLSRAASPVLRVPSVVIPSESNFLLNPVHPLFHKLRLGKPIPFLFDLRLTRQR